MTPIFNELERSNLLPATRSRATRSDLEVRDGPTQGRKCPTVEKDRGVNNDRSPLIGLSEPTPSNPCVTFYSSSELLAAVTVCVRVCILYQTLFDRYFGFHPHQPAPNAKNKIKYIFSNSLRVVFTFYEYPAEEQKLYRARLRTYEVADDVTREYGDQSRTMHGRR